jgi:hypothetical protein
MRFFMSLAITALAIAGAGPVWAATVNVKSGQVFIDRGKGYLRVTGPTDGQPGDTVMVGSAGEIVYADGCRQPVEVGAVVSITDTSPCGATNAEGFADHTLIIGGLVVAGGVGAAIALSGGGDDDKPASAQ